MEIENEVTPPNIEVNFKETPIQLSAKSSKYYIYNSLQQHNHTDKKATIYMKSAQANFTLNSIFTYSFELSNLIDYVGNIEHYPLLIKPIRIYSV